MLRGEKHVRGYMQIDTNFAKRLQLFSSWMACAAQEFAQ